MASPNTGARHHGQGAPGICSLPRINKIAPKNYGSTLRAYPITSGGTTAVAKGGHTPPDNVGGTLVRSLSFATPVAVPASNSLSTLSQSTKETTKNTLGKCDAPSISKSSEKRMRGDPTSSFFDDKEDKELKYVPITDKAAKYFIGGYGTKALDNNDDITKAHCKAFMLKAFPPVDRKKSYNNPQAKSASMAQCRPKSEVDYIKFVVANWQKGTEIHTMEEGKERDDLLSFRQNNKLGNKYTHQYSVEEVWAPGDAAPRLVLRRLEVEKETKLVVVGRIVISREKLFDAINEWHHQNGHLGQERTWEFCRNKYWNVTQWTRKEQCICLQSCVWTEIGPPSVLL
jgi:hypothetical protein